MRYLIIPLLACFMSTAHGATPTDVLQEFSTLLEGGRYAEALVLGERVARSEDYGPQVRASMLHGMARFLENDAGAFERAMMLHERILGLPLPPESSVRQAAREAIDRLRAQKERFADVYGELERIGQGSAAKGEAESAIATLKMLMEKNPDFPEIETIRYYLGLYLFQDGRYAQSYRELKEAYSHRAGVAVKLPNLPRLRDQARKKWVQAFVHAAAWSFIGGFLVVTALLFYGSRPWRWVGLRHVVLVAVLVLAWYAVYSVASKRIGATAQEAASDAPGGMTAQFSTLGNPAEEAFEALFRYGLLGTLGVAAFAIATARFRLRWTVTLANGVVAVFLFTSLMIVFYERHGMRGRAYLSMESPSLIDRLKTVILYTTEEIEPFLLTNPTAFPNINIVTIHDPETREWFVPYLVRMTEEKTRREGPE